MKPNRPSLHSFPNMYAGECKRACSAGELLRDRVVGQALDRVVVRVAEHALVFGGPNDDRLVSAARGETLTVARVGHRVDETFVTAQ